MSTPKAILRDSLYIPVEYLDEDMVQENYTHHLFDDKVCKGCMYKRDRPVDACDSCEWGGYTGSICALKSKSVNGTRYIGFPMGDRTEVERKAGIDFDDFKFKDLRSKIPFDYPIKFTASLRDYQEPAVKEMRRIKYGILKAPPRSGKTVMGIDLICKLKNRAVILANQKDFLEGFEETIASMTNLPELEKKHGKKLYGFPKKQEDYENFQISLITYQSLISDKLGSARLKWVNANYGNVIIDEVHTGNAKEFSILLSKVAQAYRFGLTATPKRKDGLQFLMQELIGPVNYNVKVATLTPIIKVHETPDVTSNSKFSGPAGFTYACKFLGRHEERHAQILRGIKYDLKKGRSIVIPCMHREHITKLVDDINCMWGSTIAEEFVGGGTSKKDKGKRKETVDRARAGETRVVVGIRKLLQLGINVPRWDCLIGSTLIPTDGGLKKIEDMCPKRGFSKAEHVVFRGDAYASTSISGSMGNKIVREVTTNSGFQLTGSLGQKVTVLKKDLSLTMVKLSDLETGDTLVMSSSDNPVSDVFQLPDLDIGIQTPSCVDTKLAYLIGCMSGDGRLTVSPSGSKKAEFYNQNRELLHRVKSIVKLKFKLDALEIGSKNVELRFNPKLYDFFDLICLSGKSFEKEVPSCILQSPKEVQLAYISGLIDTDGFVSKSKHSSNVIVGITSSSFNKVGQIQQMLFHSFNYVFSYNPLATPTICNINGVQSRPVYDLRVQALKGAEFAHLISKYSIKAKGFPIPKRNNIKVAKYECIPGLKAIFQPLKNPSGRYYDIDTGERVSLHLQKWSNSPSIQHLKSERVVEKLMRVFPDVGKKLKVLLDSVSSFQRVIFLQESSCEVPTYDFSMADETRPRFSAAGFIVHNCLYYIMPMSNEPNWEQESARILTPDTTGDKQEPLIRMFIDPSIGLSIGCFRNTWNFSLKFGYQPDAKSKKLVYSLLGEDRKAQQELAMEIDDPSMLDRDDPAFSKLVSKSPRSLSKIGKKGVGRRL